MTMKMMTLETKIMKAATMMLKGIETMSEVY